MLQFARFAALRASFAVVTLLLVSFIVFSLMELVPAIVPNAISRSKTPKAR